jgi:hypothetical protein
MPEDKKTRGYIGDGVYVIFDGFGVELRANDFENPSDRIYLEPDVFANLERFYRTQKEEKIV